MKYDSEEFWERYEERAAIMEFDGGLSRTEAEKRAFEDICRQCNE